MIEEEITGIRSKKTVLIVLEVVNDVCRDEFNAQYFFEINGELFCLVGIVPKGNAFLRVSFYINIIIKL
jgi:hypothetical protein